MLANQVSLFTFLITGVRKQDGSGWSNDSGDHLLVPTRRGMYSTISVYNENINIVYCVHLVRFMLIIRVMFFFYKSIPTI